MGMASMSGRAVTNPANPRAFAVCDRCQFLYNHDKLKWQYQWQGTQLTNLRILVCSTCCDEPQPQLKARLMPPDPVPIRDPRPDMNLWPFNTSDYAVEALVPSVSIGTEINPSINFPAGVPMEIEP